ncbi:TRSP domain-containing protein, partial [Nostoc sp. CHAB 5834]|nr:TRSP domain-containing protein [Nostoc sp. CHAB 5834]
EYDPSPGFECPSVGSAIGNDEDKGQLIPLDLHRLGATMPLAINPRSLLQRVSLSKEAPVYVIGDGEHMHPAFLLGAALEQMGFEAFVQSTTRSPILKGGAIESLLTFEDHYGDRIPNYLYNAPPKGAQVLFVHESTGQLHLLSSLTAIPVHISELLGDSVFEFQP